MRLIDADKLIEKLRDFKEWENDDGRPIHTMSEIQRIDRCINFAQTEPTAFDADKVVSELEKNASRYTKKYVTPYGNNRYKDTKAVSIHKAIEIVRQGCVAVANNATTKNDDVCECRLLKGYNFLHKTSCGDVFEMENGFKFCPYCGKKIKIVGG